MRIFPGVLAIVLGSAVLAEDLAYPPTDFSYFVVWAPVAYEITNRCTELELRSEVYDSEYQRAVDLLEANGVEPSKWREQTKGVPPGIKDLPKTEFYFKFGIRENSPESEWCKAGRALTGQSGLPGKLLKVSGE